MSAPDGVVLADVPLQGFMSASSAPQGYAFHPVMPRRVVTLLGGHGGSGKSYLGLALLAHGACGVPFATFEPDGATRGVYLSLEDEPARVLARLREITRTYGLNAAMIEANLRVVDGTEHGGALVREFNEFGVRSVIETNVFAALSKAVTGADLIVVDNASDAYDGDENSRRQVRAFIRSLTRLAREHNAAVVLLVHIDKIAARNGARGQSYSGSTAWHNSTRSRLALTEDKGELTLTHEKANFSACASPVTLRRNDRGVPVPVVGGRPTQRQADDDDALALVRAAARSGIRVPTATSGPQTALEALSHLPEAEPFNEREKGRRDLLAALERLHRDGVLRVVKYWKNRNPREAWQLTIEPVEAGSDRREDGSESDRSLVPHTPQSTNARSPSGDSCIRYMATDERLTTTNELTIPPSRTTAADYRAAKDGER